MTTTARIGSGAAFAVETAAGSGTYTTLGEVTHITPPAASVDAQDATHMASPSYTREFVAGLIDPGEVSMDMNWDPSSATDDFIEAWKQARETRGCRITFADAETWAFSAFPTNYAPDVPQGEIMTAQLTCKVTGVITKS